MLALVSLTCPLTLSNSGSYNMPDFINACGGKFAVCSSFSSLVTNCNASNVQCLNLNWDSFGIGTIVGYHKQ